MVEESGGQEETECLFYILVSFLVVVKITFVTGGNAVLVQEAGGQNNTESVIF